MSDDEQFLHAMGVSIHPPPEHAECHRRWQEEREAREIAERAAARLVRKVRRQQWMIAALYCVVWALAIWMVVTHA